MNYKSTTGTSIKDAFEKYHQENPSVYEHFKRYANNWIATGATKISSKQIIGRIRWFVNIELKEKEVFKCNDAFTSHYARLFVKDFPAYSNIFEFRDLRS